MARPLPDIADWAATQRGWFFDFLLLFVGIACCWLSSKGGIDSAIVYIFEYTLVFGMMYQQSAPPS